MCILKSGAVQSEKDIVWHSLCETSCPPRTVHSTKKPCQVAQFHFPRCTSRPDGALRLSRLIAVDNDHNVTAVHYGETIKGPLLFTSHYEGSTICATNMHNGQTMWKIRATVDGKVCRPGGLCYGEGKLFVTDCCNTRVLVFDAVTRSFIQSITLLNIGVVVNVSWSKQQPHLIVNQVHKDKDKNNIHHVRYFNIN